MFTYIITSRSMTFFVQAHYQNCEGVQLEYLGLADLAPHGQARSGHHFTELEKMSNPSAFKHGEY